MDYDIKILYNELIKVQKKLDSLQEKEKSNRIKTNAQYQIYILGTV